MKDARFALIGVAGFVARRHLDAIQTAGGELVAALDPHDSVGILDRYALGAEYFTDEASWASHLTELRRAGRGVNYVVVCSPNHLHAQHIELGLGLGADVICEKPLVTKASDLDRLLALQKQHQGRVHPILQLRYHPTLVALADEFSRSRQPALVEFDYVTPRGAWYDRSWKGDALRSGGLLLNIGVHFIDALLWIFGPVVQFRLHQASRRTVRGELELERAHVRFRLSIDADELPSSASEGRRRLSIPGREIDLGTTLEGLHDRAYAAILDGRGLDLEQARPALELCFALAADATHAGTAAERSSAEAPVTFARGALGR